MSDTERERADRRWQRAIERAKAWDTGLIARTLTRRPGHATERNPMLPYRVPPTALTALRRMAGQRKAFVEWQAGGVGSSASAAARRARAENGPQFPGAVAALRARAARSPGGRDRESAST